MVPLRWLAAEEEWLRQQETTTHSQADSGSCSGMRQPVRLAVGTHRAACLSCNSSAHRSYNGQLSCTADRPAYNADLTDPS